MASFYILVVCSVSLLCLLSLLLLHLGKLLQQLLLLLQLTAPVAVAEPIFPDVAPAYDFNWSVADGQPGANFVTSEASNTQVDLSLLWFLSSQYKSGQFCVILNLNNKSIVGSYLKYLHICRLTLWPIILIWIYRSSCKLSHSMRPARFPYPYDVTL